MSKALAAFDLATVREDFHRHQVAAGAESNKEPYVGHVTTIADSIAPAEFQQ